MLFALFHLKDYFYRKKKFAKCGQLQKKKYKNLGSFASLRLLKNKIILMCSENVETITIEKIFL